MVKRILVYAALMLFVFLLSCKKDTATNPPGLPSGRTAVTIYKNTVVGYIVATAEFVQRPYPQNQTPDLEISIERTTPSGLPVGLCMNANRPTFALAGTFGGPESARAFFNSFTTAIDTGLSRTTCDTAKPAPHMPSNQVWSLKTRDDKYAKLLIVANFVYVPTPDSTGITTLFDWVYQPDGTKNF